MKIPIPMNRTNLLIFRNEKHGSSKKLSTVIKIEKWSRQCWRNMSFSIEACQDQKYFLALLIHQDSTARKKRMIFAGASRKHQIETLREEISHSLRRNTGFKNEMSPFYKNILAFLPHRDSNTRKSNYFNSNIQAEVGGITLRRWR